MEMYQTPEWQTLDAACEQILQHQSVLMVHLHLLRRTTDLAAPARDTLTAAMTAGDALWQAAYHLRTIVDELPHPDIDDDEAA